MRDRGDVGSEGHSRGAARERAILSAVISLLGETGYEAMTMDAVAARAHASKTTIYRRWPGKPDLVRAAVDSCIAERVLRPADTGSLRGDLLAVLNEMQGHLTPEFMAMMSGLIHAMRADAVLAASLRSVVDGDSVSAEIFARAAGRGELPASEADRLAGLAHEVIEAQVLRQLAAGGSLGRPFARHVVDDIVLPLLAGAVMHGGPRNDQDNHEEE